MSLDLTRKDPYEQQKLHKRLRRQVGQAIADFDMIEEGDKVMVCLSGGKDSYTLLDLLMQLQEKAPVHFELVVAHLDQKQPGYLPEVLPGYLRSRGVPFTILEQDTYSVVKRVVPAGKTLCGLCSRLRRGALYTHAAETGCSKIALGHHRDDIVETLFLNLFHQAKLSAMPPKLRSDDGRHIVIRPLAYCAERDIAAYAAAKRFPILPCNLCGTQETLQRKAIKAMLADWERKTPGRVENTFRALAAVHPSHLADRDLYDFAAISTGRGARADRSVWLGGDSREGDAGGAVPATPVSGLEILEA
ncbi:MAG: tRNA 2-thiocytidine(32) synthetase TtcA [Xanthomonadales bacterium]|jgi:tRNA 2-thiocytidine biosynthesis protein TtcA|nr:tRNA 2-thiocytidine(32) synthetase TtcA [Xanthomonadales bacterium]MBK7143736.1 tRNA 2-thiocytidine(32) synthetase TtcA [Xanthomonadales bacterium]MCC6560765.1 tRNA 2-thiocytidine(32) synthetase TtcA [Xanthomonadales bacterium]